MTVKGKSDRTREIQSRCDEINAASRARALAANTKQEFTDAEVVGDIETVLAEFEIKLGAPRSSSPSMDRKDRRTQT